MKFKTAHGRTVYDGGGIDPDVDVGKDLYAPITVSLITKGLIFNYATEYAYRKGKIPAADEFKLTDQEYAEFKQWISDKDYDYTTKVEQDLVKLEESAKKEKYFTDIEDQLRDLQMKVKHNKEIDLERFRNEIKQVLEEEIASRFYLQKGSIEASFDEDLDVQAAIELLEDTEKYKKLLSNK